MVVEADGIYKREKAEASSEDEELERSLYTIEYERYLSNHQLVSR